VLSYDHQKGIPFDVPVGDSDFFDLDRISATEVVEARGLPNLESASRANSCLGPLRLVLWLRGLDFGACVTLNCGSGCGRRGVRSAKFPGCGVQTVLREIRPPGVDAFPNCPCLLSTVSAPPCSHSPSGPSRLPQWRREGSRSAAWMRAPDDWR